MPSELIQYFVLNEGENPALPIGAEVYYGCLDSEVFSHDWYMRPVIRIVCTETGVFSSPEDWPYCIHREFTLLILQSEKPKLVFDIFSERLGSNIIYAITVI